MASSYVLINDLRFHYLHWNQDGAGPPVVLLHGLASNARIWELVAPYLVERDLIVLAPDLRGHGLTDKPEGGYGFDMMTQDLAACLDACHVEKPVLVGHSWGGSVALDYAARFGIGPRAPAGLVLVDGGMTQLNDAADGAQPPTWEEVRQRLAPPRLAGMRLDEFLKILSEGRNGWRPDDQSIPIILANFEVYEDEEEGVEKIRPHLSYQHHMQIVRAMWEFPTYQKFDRIHCPVLMVPARPPQPFGEREQRFLEAKQRGVRQARQRIGDLQVHWMEDSIHDIPLQHPAGLAAELAGFATEVAGNG